MIPSVVATQVRNCVSDYLNTTFRPTTVSFEGLMDRFLADSDNYCRGPYVSLGLPFRQGQTGAGYFKHIPLAFHPHLHQEQAFGRLSPPYYQSTLVATGTGSGKTECFLLPLLEHCRQQAGKPGIKAILIYPMNALATDQAKRIAKLIYNTPALANVDITAGLYVGEQDEHPTSQMGPDKVITDKPSLRVNPPDILLTNYKMLDYLLIQPDAQSLWQHNSADAEMLRYLVVDEFHTFDGAQGTDLACLLRRLKHRLKTPKHHLACVGTSATLGGEGNKAEMLAYATTIFEEPFDERALIEEDRLSAQEFLADAEDINVFPIPAQQQLDALSPDRYHTPAAYIRAQARLWLPGVTLPTEGSTHLLYGEALNAENLAQASGTALDDDWCIALGKQLKTLPIVQNLLRQLGRDGAVKVSTYDNLMAAMARRLGLTGDLPETYQQRLLDSLMSLIAAARRSVLKPDGTATTMPWVTLRIQYWFRELKRMVATVEATPHLVYSDDLTAAVLDRAEVQPPKTLPVLHCRDCGATGWGGVRPSQGNSKLEADNLRGFYQAYFGQNPLMTLMFPCEPTEPLREQICGQCLTLNGPRADHCHSCGHRDLVCVYVPDMTKGISAKGQKQLIAKRDCPYCNSSGLAIIGAQAASLTSAMIGVLYTTPYNSDKKLLAFSDSVQDAAHRAGFYSARTYRTTLRTAIAQIVRELTTTDTPLTLHSLLETFPTYWQQQFSTTADYIATFLPSDLAWLREWDSHLQSDDRELSTDTNLPKLLSERLSWEVTNQFGHRAAVGPSLERSAVCGVFFDPTRLQSAAAALQLKLSNEIEALRLCSVEQIQQFLLGWLHHLRLRGGILQPATEGYISSGGNTYLWNKVTYMPNMGPTVPRPIFFANASAQVESFEAVIGRDQRSSWSEDWTARILASTSLLLKDQLIEILHSALESAVEAGLLAARSCNSGRAWGIPTDALLLQATGRVLACDRCSHQLTTAPAEQALMVGMCCTARGCIGHYQLDDRQGLTYYREIYQQGEVQRIVAAEHTGLLSRSNRERLEKQFINSKRRCDPNLISATSTLEMGINIGDLSTVLLSSVPPGTANFQQRIGRGGRRDGNALVGVVANGKPHDLFFYANPNKMLAGKIEAAGCYLDASAILQRQLTAFCLDSWVSTGISRQDFPPLLSDVLNALERKDKACFPLNWITYIQAYQGELLDAFLRLFEAQADTRTQQELRDFMEKGINDEGGLCWRVLNRLGEVRQERTRLSSQIRTIGKKITQLKAEPAALREQENNQERLSELERERKGFRTLMKDLNRKSTLNFLTDEGLLPNYAFPEAGVTLRSILWRRRTESDDGSGQKYETYPVSYERPGNIAIRELVPSGVFYAEGRRVKIDQIDLNLSKPEDWRICRSCSYSVQAIKPEASRSNCPRCDDAMWPDQGQHHKMLRLRQVMATTSDRDSRFGDDSEDRNTAFFQRHLLIDFVPEYREKTFLIDDDQFPFGFEYISRTSFREINLGESEAVGQTVKLAGREARTRGFEICSGCGKVIGRANRRAGSAQKDRAKDHMVSCRWRDKPDQAKAIEVLYLYREFESESIRLLMPDDTFWTPEGLHSFIAALQLGLRQRFGGQASHLHTAISEEPQPNSTLRKSFLYLYDSVPGGTGYLRQLIRNPEELKAVFESALKVIRACACKDSTDSLGKDGCYECLFAYRNSFDQDKTSRKKALGLLSAIAHHWPSLKQTDQGLSSIRLNSNFESELERRFIEAIRRYRPNGDPTALTLRPEVFDGKDGYYLKLGDTAWFIETQVVLGKQEGVDIPSRADFVIRPASQKTISRPIVIFTDGWEYHKDRIWEDFQQRLAILRSNQFYCWSLSWNDIAQQIDPDAVIEWTDGLGLQLNRQFSDHRQQWYERYGCQGLSLLEGQRSFEWLMHYLAQPDANAWQGWALLRTLAQAEPTLAQATHSPWQSSVSRETGAIAIDLWHLPEQFLQATVQVSEQLIVRHAADLSRHPQASAPQLDAEGSFVLISLDDQPSPHTASLRASWNEALRLLNLYQFLPHVYAVTSSAVRSGQQPILADPPLAKHPPSNDQDEAWEEVRSLIFEERLQGIIAQLQVQNRPIPTAGYALTDDREIIIAEAELAWLHQKIAIVSYPEDISPFEQAGWQVLTLEAILHSSEALHAKLASLSQ